MCRKPIRLRALTRRHSGHGGALRRWDDKPATSAVSDVIQAIGL